MDCSNCSSPFTETALPKLLITCGHTICQPCLQQLFSSNRIICPECSQENIISSISQVPTNQALLNINLSPKESINHSYDMGFHTFKRHVATNGDSPKSSKRNVLKCQIHSKNIEAFCMQDYEGLCIDCILSENYKNKEILSIDKATNILQEKIRKDLQISIEKEKKMKRNLETLEKQEKNLCFWKKRNEDEIKTFFDEFQRILKEKELKCLETNEFHFTQNMTHLKSSKKSNEANLTSITECNKILGVLSNSNRIENGNGEFLQSMKLVYQIKAKMGNFGEIICEEPNYENYVFDKESEIKMILMKLKENYGGSLNPAVVMKEKIIPNENVNNTVCYYTNTSEEKRGINNISMLIRPSQSEKENTSPLPLTILPSKSNSPFSLEKKNLKTTKSVNFKNFSSNVGFDQRHSPNIKINRSKSPVLNQRKHSKPDNISYTLIRKLKTDLEDTNVNNMTTIESSSALLGRNKKNIYNTLGQKDVSNSLKDLSYKNNSKSNLNLALTKKNNVEEKKQFKIFTVGGFSLDKQFSIEEYDSRSKDWTVKFNSPVNKAKFGSVVYCNSIILFGGKSDGKRLNNFYKYDCFSSKMTEMNLKLTVAKSGFGYCIKDDEIFVCGGNDGSSILDTFESYNLKTFAIKKLPSMNYKRDELAIVLDYKDNIYAIGGYCNQNNCLNSVEKFDFKLNKWIMVASLIEPRRSLNAVVLSQNIYAIGGFNGFQYLNSVEKYDEVHDKWVAIKPMKESRCTFSAIGLNEEGTFIVMGGFNNTPLSSCEIFNEKKDSWENFKTLEMKRFMHSCNLLYLD